MSNNDTQFNSDKCLDECAKVAQIYALEQQLELLNSISAFEDNMWSFINGIQLQLEEQLKSLK